MIIKIRFDAADYSWEGDGYRGHDDRLAVEWIDLPHYTVPRYREFYDLTPDGIAEMLETI